MPVLVYQVDTVISKNIKYLADTRIQNNLVRGYKTMPTVRKFISNNIRYRKCNIFPVLIFSEVFGLPANKLFKFNYITGVNFRRIKNKFLD